MEAVNVGDRQGYVKLMQSLIGKDFRYVKTLPHEVTSIMKMFLDMS